MPKQVPAIKTNWASYFKKKKLEKKKKRLPLQNKISWKPATTKPNADIGAFILHQNLMWTRRKMDLQQSKDKIVTCGVVSEMHLLTKWVWTIKYIWSSHRELFEACCTIPSRGRSESRIAKRGLLGNVRGKNFWMNLNVRRLRHL